MLTMSATGVAALTVDKSLSSSADLLGYTKRSLCRALQPGDFESLRSAHFDMFPVDYEDAFFERVVRRQDGLESLAAVSRSA